MMFSEAIKVRDGGFYNLDLHLARMNRTAMHHFGHGVTLDLTPDMVPAELRSGLVKCRVVYGERVESVEFAPYLFRIIRSVAVVHDDTVEYTFKSTDRGCIDTLRREAGTDDIIIVKNGLVTDSSFANIVLELPDGTLHTPSTPLLAGTKREKLLREGTISEREIREAELRAASKIYLINAMIDLEDNQTLKSLFKNIIHKSLIIIAINAR